MRNRSSRVRAALDDVVIVDDVNNVGVNTVDDGDDGNKRFDIVMIKESAQNNSFSREGEEKSEGERG